jgi:hypothetical protein
MRVSFVEGMYVVTSKISRNHLDLRNTKEYNNLKYKKNNLLVQIYIAASGSKVLETFLEAIL